MKLTSLKQEIKEKFDLKISAHNFSDGKTFSHKKLCFDMICDLYYYGIFMGGNRKREEI